jgi:hypothetical protein
LVAGGGAQSGLSAKAAVFDPAAPPNGKWTTVGSMNFARRLHSAVLLQNGKILVMGGIDPNLNILASSEIFDPATGQWSLTAPLATARSSCIAELLPNGKVLVAGGDDTNFQVTATSELYDVGLGFSNSWRPQITSFIPSLTIGGSLFLLGSNFRGVSEASSGNGPQNSSSDCPVVQLRSIETGQVTFLSSANWQKNIYFSLPLSKFPIGYALATMFVNGIPSISQNILVSAPAPTPIVLSNPTLLPNGAFRFDFTNTAGALFTVLGSTDLTPATRTVLGDVKEIGPGQFQFTDLLATNNPQRFYQVHSP